MAFKCLKCGQCCCCIPFTMGHFKRFMDKAQVEYKLKSIKMGKEMMVYPQTKDNRCIFQNRESNLCEIYNNRPQICRIYGTKLACYHNDPERFKTEEKIYLKDLGLDDKIDSKRA